MMKKMLFTAAAAALLTFPAAAENLTRTRTHHLAQTIGTEDIVAEIKFGKEVGARILGKYPLHKNDALTRYANLVAKTLAQYSNRPELAFTVGVLDTDMINGFATPGGYIFITRGAIEAMEDESELAAVIGHEMMHVCQRHIVKELNIHGTSDSPVSGFSHMIGGAGEAVNLTFVRAVDEATNILFERGYKKQDEIEADTMGTMLAANAGYDPTALIRYFKKIKTGQDKEIASIKKLHPSFDERIQWINQSIEKDGLGGNGYKIGKERFNGVLARKG